MRHVRDTPAQQAWDDLAADGRLPHRLRTADVAQRGADLLEWVWTQTLAPDWPRRRRILEGDIVSRTQRLASGGWATALDGMRRGIRWLGDGRLQINKYDNPTRAISDGAELMFIPSTASRGWVAWAEPRRYAIVYPCAGLLADASPAAADALGRLIGPARAEILVQLAEPRSTSQLVALTAFSLGSVGGHLKVMLDAGLVSRRRAGRSVLYYRTELGERLARMT